MSSLHFIDNPAAPKDKFIVITVDAQKVMASWRLSMFAHEWLTRDGEIKAFDILTPDQQSEYRTIEDGLTRKAALTKPILGIGIMDNVEIGSGRTTFLALTSKGITHIPVHIPKSSADEFKTFM